jgi:hypothetical protein
MYTREDCIEGLKQARKELGHSPTIREYNELDISPSAGTIRKTIGWDEAKELSDLDKCDSTKERTKPNGLNITSDEWKSYSTQKQRKLERRVFVAKKKISEGCQECGYQKRASALDYHHTGKEKGMSVAERVTRCHSKKKILEEIERCEVLCANCHRIETDSTIDLSNWDS